MTFFPPPEIFHLQSVSFSSSAAFLCVVKDVEYHVRSKISILGQRGREGVENCLPCLLQTIEHHKKYFSMLRNPLDSIKY